MILWASPASASDALCGDDPPAVVDETLLALWEAYATVDETAFDRVGKNLVAAIACLDRAPSPVQISRLHQGMALSAFVNGQTRASKRSLAAARMMDPSWKLPENLFPEGHPMRGLWAAATDPGPTDEIGRISPESWVVDGVVRPDAPVDRAFLVQVQRQDGSIAWSGYLWDWEGLPDRGQNDQKSPLATPFSVGLSIGPEGRLLKSVQDATQAGWPDQDGAELGGGLAAGVRLTPLSVVGGEAGVSFSGPADVVVGGGGQPSGHAALLLGGAGWLGGWQPHGALRAGVAVDRFRAWAGTVDQPVPVVWTLVSGLFGVEGGVRSDQGRVAVAVDVLLADLRVYQGVRTRLDGGVALVGPLALEGSVQVRTTEQPVLDPSLDPSPEVGTRSDTDLRAGVALALWY